MEVDGKIGLVLWNFQILTNSQEHNLSTIWGHAYLKKKQRPTIFTTDSK
jgi:hypothetical protein